MGKTDLGKWMITNGGEYSADATYEQLTMVKYGNSTYITLKTVTGITPTDDKINYQLMAQGFDATALSAVQAEDTQGLCGEKGEIVTAQSLVDALADKVMNTVMAKIGTAALTGGMTDLSSGVNSLYSNLELYNNPTAVKLTSANNKITDMSAYIANIAPKVYVCYGFIETNGTISKDENVFSISNLREISSLLLYAAESNLFTPLLYRNGNMAVPNNATLTSGYYYVCGTIISE